MVVVVLLVVEDGGQNINTRSKMVVVVAVFVSLFRVEKEAVLEVVVVEVVVVEGSRRLLRPPALKLSCLVLHSKDCSRDW